MGDTRMRVWEAEQDDTLDVFGLEVGALAGEAPSFHRGESEHQDSRMSAKLLRVGESVIAARFGSCQPTTRRALKPAPLHVVTNLGAAGEEPAELGGGDLHGHTELLYDSHSVAIAFLTSDRCSGARRSSRTWEAFAALTRRASCPSSSRQGRFGELSVESGVGGPRMGEPVAGSSPMVLFSSVGVVARRTISVCGAVGQSGPPCRCGGGSRQARHPVVLAGGPRWDTWAASLRDGTLAGAKAYVIEQPSSNASVGVAGKAPPQVRR